MVSIVLESESKHVDLVSNQIPLGLKLGPQIFRLLWVGNVEPRQFTNVGSNQPNTTTRLENPKSLAQERTVLLQRQMLNHVICVHKLGSAV